MRKWSLIIELEPNGDWSALAMLGKQLIGSAQADNLQLVQEMGAELLQGCVESTEMSAEEEAVVKKIVWAAAVPAPGRGQFLSIEIEQGQLVIRIGVDALVEAAESSQEFRPFNQEANDFDQWKVRDAGEFAKEVANALHDEEEDGSTDITKALDAACLKALESGCKADLVKALAGATAPPKEGK